MNTKERAVVLSILEQVQRNLINLAGTPMTAGQGQVLRINLARVQEVIEMIEHVPTLKAVQS